MDIVVLSIPRSRVQILKTRPILYEPPCVRKTKPFRSKNPRLVMFSRLEKWPDEIQAHQTRA